MTRKMISFKFLLLCHWVLYATSEPTIIFMGQNARPVVSGPGASSSQYPSPNPVSSSQAYSIQTIRPRDSSSSHGGTLSSLASVIRDRFSEKFQERSSKKGPRIIVIPTGQKASPAAGSTTYLPSASSPYSSPFNYGSASMYSPTYAQAQGPYSSPYTSPYSYFNNPLTSMASSSSSSPYAASTPLASYAYPPPSLSQSLRASAIYHYVAQLLSSLY